MTRGNELSSARYVRFGHYGIDLDREDWFAPYIPPRKVLRSVLIRSLRPYVRPVDALAHERWPRWFPRQEFQTILRPDRGQGARTVPRRGSIDHTICSLSCKFRHPLSTVAASVAPRVWPISRPRLPCQRPRISRCRFPLYASSSRRCAKLVRIAGAFGCVGHGVLFFFGRCGCGAVLPFTKAYPLRSICWAISGDVEAIVVPSGIAFPAISQGPSSTGRFVPVASTVNPYISGILAD